MPLVFDEIARGIPGKKVLLVAQSADDARDCRRFGTAGVLAKPLTVESVRHTVNTVLGRGPGLTPLRILEWIGEKLRMRCARR